MSHRPDFAPGTQWEYSNTNYILADLARFYRALFGGRLLPPAQLAEMETTVPATAYASVFPGAAYGSSTHSSAPRSRGDATAFIAGVR